MSNEEIMRKLDRIERMLSTLLSEEVNKRFHQEQMRELEADTKRLKNEIEITERLMRAKNVKDKR